MAALCVTPTEVVGTDVTWGWQHLGVRVVAERPR